MITGHGVLEGVCDAEGMCHPYVPQPDGLPGIVLLSETHTWPGLGLEPRDFFLAVSLLFIALHVFLLWLRVGRLVKAFVAIAVAIEDGSEPPDPGEARPRQQPALRVIDGAQSAPDAA